LFERSLDPGRRAQLGAHYTSRADILLVVEPVLMLPLRRRWVAVQAEAGAIILRREAAGGAARARQQEALAALLLRFQDEIMRTRVLDPACGSGNFLYVALGLLLDLEKEVSVFAATSGLSALLPRVGPEQLFGIEVNPYAHELASIVVWIGYLQWRRENGYLIQDSPILRPLANIQRMDALLAYGDDGLPVEPAWPEAEVIVGNPPFVGGNKIRKELGDSYVEDLFKLYAGRLPAFADLVTYWFEKARAMVAAGKVRRVGLLATQGIRGGVNRRVLERIKAGGDIFLAYADRQWVLDGANVHVSIVGFDDGSERERSLDAQPVATINANLTASVNVNTALPLAENTGIAYQGPSPKGAFDIELELAKRMLAAPLNVNGRPNSDVVRPVASAIDLVQHSRGKYTIDFALRNLPAAVGYEQPFEYVRQHVQPVRTQNRRVAYAERWWQYAEPRPGMRAALQGLFRFIATPRVSKHRIFVWLDASVLSNDGTIVFARDDYYFFGVLHSRVHELWSLRLGTALEDRPRYTPTTTFETFPFPWPPGQEPASDQKVQAIAVAARRLVELRDNWLHPPGASEAELKKRTLTNLYNARPTWLALAHQTLDNMVAVAYGWPTDLGDEEVLSRLLELNEERSR